MFLRLSLFIALALNLYSEENIGFLMNQKYVCFSVGALKDDKIFPIMSKEDVLKYPIRFYVDDKRILHTDGKVRNVNIVSKINFIAVCPYSFLNMEILYLLINLK
jgi:hypothetical protein